MRAAFFFAIVMLLAPCFPALGQRAQGVLPLDQILSEIRRTHPGQFYDADGPSPSADGRQHYHLKWMTPDGRIEWLDTDARTGQVLSASPGRDTFDAPGPPRSFPQAPTYPAPENRGRFRFSDGGALPVLGGLPGQALPMSGGFPPSGERDYDRGRFEGRDFGRRRGR